MTDKPSTDKPKFETPTTETPTAYDAYEKLADHYAASIDTKPHNAYYDRPAVLSLLPDVKNKMVLDAGCGPGVYAEELLSRGANVISCDISDKMLANAAQRLRPFGDRVQLLKVDLSNPLTMFEDEQFDLVSAPLCFDYIEDWRTLFAELYRVLKPRGAVIFSCGHPAFDAEYFKTVNYFSVEHAECTWTGFGIDVLMPGYRRSLEEILAPPIEAGFVLERVHEPLPTEEFKRADPLRYMKLMYRPCFLCVRARK